MKIHRIPVLVFLSVLTSVSGQDLFSGDTIIKMALDFHDADYQALLKENKQAKTDIAARLTVMDEVVLDKVGVRYKGTSSYNIAQEKKSFNISIDAFVAGQHLWGHKTLNLNNGFVDPTFMREKLAHDIFTRYMPGLKTGYVHLYINGEDYGLYIQVQQLNRDFLQQWYASSSGNLYKGDPLGTLHWKGDDPSPYREDYEKKTNEPEDDWRDLIRLIEVINKAQDLEAELPLILNVDRALWYFALCNILVNLDSYIFAAHNYFIYHDPQTGLFDFLPWDLNESFGVYPPELQEKETFPPLDHTAGFKSPLLERILSVPTFAQMYWAHYRTVLRESFVWDAIREQIDAIRPVIDKAVLADPKKLYTYDHFNQNIYEDVYASERRIPGLRSFVNQRRDFLMSLPDLTRPEPVIAGMACITEQLTPGRTAVFHLAMSGDTDARVRLYYRIGSGRFEQVGMFDDGNHADAMAGDGVYGASVDIPADAAGKRIDFYGTAASREGVMTFFPERAAFTWLSGEIVPGPVATDIVINEFMAANSQTVQDPQGNYPDWIELYNRGTQVVSLQGWYLTDDPADIHKWQFGTITLEPDAYLLIWADKDVEDFGLHANHRLNQGGEYIGLYDGQSKLIDAYTFGEQQADVSAGRYPNGSGGFTFMTRPTPGTENLFEARIPPATPGP